MRQPSESVDLNESELVGQSRNGDRAAFTELVNRYAAKVFRLARHITKNDHDAEDVLQEAFLKAYTRLDQFQGNSRFYTWLVRIAVNEALMKLRRAKTRKTVSLDQELESEDGSLPRETASERYDRRETREYLTKAIDSLAEAYGSVLVLRDIEGLSTEETAEMLGLSVSAVKSRLLRARLQLREKLKRQLGRNGRQTQNQL